MSDLLNLFMSAQLAEEQCDNDAAAKFYTELISMADNNDKIKPVTDEDFHAGSHAARRPHRLHRAHVARWPAPRRVAARGCREAVLFAASSIGNQMAWHCSTSATSSVSMARSTLRCATTPPRLRCRQLTTTTKKKMARVAKVMTRTRTRTTRTRAVGSLNGLPLPRVETVGLASYMSALLHHQALQFDDALPYLRRFARLRYRLSPALWKLASRPPSSALTLATDSTDAKTVRRFDGCVPPPLLSKLQEAFSIDSPFWKESGYAERGYFSFWHDSATQPRSLVDALAHHLLPLTGCEDSIVGCEWWVHTRAEGRSIGHQMHFDTEEFTLSTGEVLHPLVSSVTYLNGSICADATVVLEQTVEDENGCDAAYVSHPLIGSTLFFPGDRLHCVVPAAPVAAAGEEAKAPPPKPSSSSSKRGQKRPHGGGSSAAASSSSSSSSSSSGPSRR